MSLEPKSEALKARHDVVLSLFPGIGLLDRAFEETGFCVVRGPDPLWGGDIHNFFSPAGHFNGVIGGPPCQNFSGLNRNRDFEAGMELVNEYLRIVLQAQPAWALMENVKGSPDVQIDGYNVQRFTLDASHCGSKQSRLRKFHFFYRPGSRELVIPRLESSQATGEIALASEGKRAGRRSWRSFCDLQGLPAGFDLPGFKLLEKYRAVGNGVPLELGRALAQAIAFRDRAVTPHRVCECGCGQFVHGKARLAGVACRKKMQRLRDKILTPAASQLALV